MNKKDSQVIVIAVIVFLFLGAWSVRAQHSGHAVPAGADDADMMDEAPLIDVSPEQQKMIGMKTVIVDTRLMQRVIRTVGRLEASERNLATVNAKVEGWIEKLHVETTGAYVRKGDPLVEIYSPELVATQQEFLLALQWAKQSTKGKSGVEGAAPTELERMMARDAQATLDAARQRLLLWDVSQEQIDRIEKTGKVVRTLTLYSPVNGYVTQKMAVAGMRVMPGEKLYDVADLSALWVIADIYEYELSLIKKGDAATITLAYLPGKDFPSSIDYIYPEIAPETRTVRIRLKLANPGNHLKPQMFANVEIKINLGNRLTVPESAVIDTGRGMVVYVDLGDGAFEPREIRTGLRSGGHIEVLRGLKKGDKVVSSANFLIDSEAQLKGVRPLPLK
jgi:Cu(I)/Ag(I) efflux system membrane fusion protein